MSVLTVARYRAITGDKATDSVVVSALIEDAIDLCVEALGRELEYAANITEALWPTKDGRLWPSRTPLMACTQWTIDGDGLIGVFGPTWPNLTGAISVVYSGGWVERSANPGAVNMLPSYIERDLAFATKALISPPSQEYPAGATSVRLGDAAVTFGPDGAPRAGADSVQWSRRTLRHRYYTVRGAGEPDAFGNNSPWG
jgi:hypothetical protein